MLLPFSDEQIEVYLSSVSGRLDTLRQVLREDKELFRPVDYFVVLTDKSSDRSSTHKAPSETNLLINPHSLKFGETFPFPTERPTNTTR
jgi:hypothetical protein